MSIDDSKTHYQPNLPQKSTKEILTRLSKFGMEKPSHVVLAFLGFLLFAISSSLFADLVSQITDQLAGLETKKKILPLPENLDFQTGMAIFLFTLVAIRAIGGVVGAYYADFVSLNLVHRLRSEIIHYYVNIPTADKDKESSGSLINSLIFNCEQLANFFQTVAFNLFREIFLLIGVLGLMFYYSWQLTVFLLIGMPIMLLLFSFIGNYLRGSNRRLISYINALSFHTGEILQAHILLKIFNTQKKEQKFMQQLSSDIAKRGIKNTLVHSSGTAVSSVILSIFVILMLFYMFALNEAGDFRVGTFTSYIFLIVSLNRPIKALAEVNKNWQKFVVFSNDVLHLIDKQPEKLAPETFAKESLEQPLQVQSLKLEKLSFRYGQEQNAKKVLDGVSANFEQGKIYAIIGSSGSGKTTLFKILLGLYTGFEGKILVNDKDFAKLDIASFRNSLGFVDQNSLAFNTSVAKNISYGSETIDYERLHEVIHKAHAEFVYDLQNGIETIVGERGVLLSGGQLQRLAIARSLYKKTSLLLLDEASSALDSVSEQAVYSTLEAQKQERIILIIAHRFSTLRIADEIVVLNKGKIEAQGPRDFVLEESQVFKELYRADIENTGC